ncbi:hypothetical protein [Pseudoalteromonas sp.]
MDSTSLKVCHNLRIVVVN